MGFTYIDPIDGHNIIKLNITYYKCNYEDKMEKEKQKERLDILLVEKGYFQTRERAKKNIMAGLVFVDNNRIDKAGNIVNINSKIVVVGNAIPYVSRGGLKLEKALKEFSISVNNKTAIDVGASTGGFTDCLLKGGASSVISIDVGYGQFAWELRIDPRVKLMERTNIRLVTTENIGCLCDICVIDVSFISLKLVLPVIKNLIVNNGEVVCLIKPQFEAGRAKVGKNGVVKDPQTHIDVINTIIGYSNTIGYSACGLSFSPIKGPKGNIEYLLYLKNTYIAHNSIEIEKTICEIVNKSHTDDF